MWSAPMMKACARPSGLGCTAKVRLMPNCEPSPSSRWKPLGLVGCRDDQDVPDAREHQRGERVVDHRLVVDRHQLLADALGDRVQSRAGAAGQDDSAHGCHPRVRPGFSWRSCPFDTMCAMPSTRRAAPRRLVRPATVIGGLLLLLVVLVLLAIPFLKAPGPRRGRARRARRRARTRSTPATPTPRPTARGARPSARPTTVQGSVQGIGGDVWSLGAGRRRPGARRTPPRQRARPARRRGGDRRTQSCRRCAARSRPSSTTATSTSTRWSDVIDDLRGGVDATGRRAGRARRRRRLPCRGRRPARRGPRPGARARSTRWPTASRRSTRCSTSCPRSSARDGEPAVPRGAAQPRRDALLRRHARRRSCPSTVDRRPADDGRDRRHCRPPPARPSRATGGRSAATRFHRGQMKPALATMAPDWAVSGNELANAWRSLRGRRLAGVVVDRRGRAVRPARGHRPDRGADPRQL